MKNLKIKKGDTVKIVAGKDKGKTGKVEKVFPKENRILVTGINQYKRHLKARSQNQPSEIVTITKPIALENSMIVCPKCKLTTRVGYLFVDKKKQRICKKCNQKI